MLSIDIPGRGHLDLEHLVLDVNGTLAFDGELIPGVAEALAAVSGTLHPVAITADTQGTAHNMAAELGIEVHIVERGAEAAQKLAFVRELGAASVAAIGNGVNDAAMLREVALGVCVVGGEGASAEAMHAADVVTGDIVHAIGLLAHPARLAATLRR
ncbi:MAG: HAD family hydrolase [Coriobacteriia bacterium]|nr:HAD family hydrolase [Coriobacteriia bacterium]